MKLLTYNIDGLNPTLLSIRIQLVLSIIVSQNADVIHLQEVVPEIYPVIRKVLSSNGYICSEPAFQTYFVMSCLKKEYQSNNLSFRVVSFNDPKARSDQGRYFLQTSFLWSANKSIQPTPYCFINAHLESCGIAFKSPSSFTRMAQLNEGLQLLLEHNHCHGANSTVSILAGDLNIRDKEAENVLKSFKESEICDLVDRVHKNNTSSKVSKGNERNDTMNTWYLPDNKSVRYRFDRIYGNSGIIASEYELIGGEELLADFCDDSMQSPSYLTPSDHRGIVIKLHPHSTSPCTQSANLSCSKSMEASAAPTAVLPTNEEGNTNQMAGLETEEEKKKLIREQRIRLLGGTGTAAAAAGSNAAAASSSIFRDSIEEVDTKLSQSSLQHQRNDNNDDSGRNVKRAKVETHPTIDDLSRRVVIDLT